MRAWQVPGAAIVIVKDDEVIYLQGHGLREIDKGDRVTPGTLFPLASCTKGFTTAALAMLVDEGKLGWDDPVRKHLPWFHLSDPLADRDVMIRDLATHRTGLAGHPYLWYRAPWSPKEAVEKAGLLPLDKPFRSAFQYQSTMFTAAGLAIESASGMPWEQFIKKRIFDPLGMSSAVCSGTEAKASPNRATGYRLDAKGVLAPVPFYIHNAPDAAGTIHASARDLSNWLRFQLNEGVLGDKRRVSAKQLCETHTPQIPIRLQGAEAEIHCFTNLISYGLAWVIQDYRGVKLVSHGGVIVGYRVHLTLVPEKKIGIAILNNRDGTQMNLALSNTLLDRLLGLPPKNWHTHIRAALEREEEQAEQAERKRRAKLPRDTKSSLELAAYSGTYEHPAYGKAIVRLDSGRLIWEWANFSGPLIHSHLDVFTLEDEEMNNPRVAFEIGADAKVASFTMTGGPGVQFLRTKK